MGFDEYRNALRTRDAMTRIATNVVNRMRPLDKLAEVTEIDRGGLIAQVRFTGDTNSVRATFARGNQPRAVGDIVRVSAGARGNFYITEVISNSAYNEYVDTFLAASVMAASKRSKTGSQALASGAFDKVTFAAVDIAVNPTMSHSSGDLTVLMPGYFNLSVNLTFDTNTTGRRAMLVTLNSSSVPTGASAAVLGDNRAPAPAGATTVNGATSLYLAEGDVLRVWGSQISGGSLNLLADQFSGCWISLVRVPAP